METEERQLGGKKTITLCCRKLVSVVKLANEKSVNREVVTSNPHSLGLGAFILKAIVVAIPLGGLSTGMSVLFLFMFRARSALLHVFVLSSLKQTTAPTSGPTC